MADSANPTSPGAETAKRLSPKGLSADAFSVVLAGGGSAGHVSPLLAIAAALRAADPGVSLLAVGTADGLETRLVPAAGVELAVVDRVPLPRKPTADLFRLPARMLRAVRQSTDILDGANASVLVGVGGYVCTPMYLAARRRGIPIVIHEANSKAGLANRLGSRFTKFTGTAFAQTRIRHGRLVGMPMRRQISALDRSSAAQKAARAALGLDPELTTLIVTGGSLGALRINQTVAQSLPVLHAAGLQVLHITGRGKRILADDGTELSAQRYRQVEYVDAMEDVYAAADLLLCRAGSGTVSELAAVGLPAVVVPLPVGNGEQALNAAPLVAAGGAVLVRDSDFTVDWLERELLPLLTDPQRLERMGTAGRELGIRDADVRMAQMVREAAGR
ncbi:undecaprenyldiphospho-muramoylpentapeptide beta-N-acetylglucosaminyltransferase [Paeniglutamicibacter antarcticus]|uniref:UDP-N-acetylglucosamine--N-acetylmuramyl-(pentapeptide) pyrophosphoryl-undecaprenol N-acetylglucosamine transferase n=1 Tax=Arthrobacter terrae TaxID=2935737 RepID=A0A931G9S5_9MICC|nr:undecaprenyldiphospho-muramoylpentapeptide beta-N-acetylglucosaminyltransferase [Arthrobacter terrae]MBG0741419.1 undecaprenyldiphospho-muramoylpentapeptide beta-N-acetylglucosaminyltransferase [Arthrobacter terrae]